MVQHEQETARGSRFQPESRHDMASCTASSHGPAAATRAPRAARGCEEVAPAPSAKSLASAAVILAHTLALGSSAPYLSGSLGQRHSQHQVQVQTTVQRKKETQACKVHDLRMTGSCTALLISATGLRAVAARPSRPTPQTNNENLSEWQRCHHTALIPGVWVWVSRILCTRLALCLNESVQRWRDVRMHRAQRLGMM